MRILEYCRRGVLGHNRGHNILSLFQQKWLQRIKEHWMLIRYSSSSLTQQRQISVPVSTSRNHCRVF